MATRKKPVARNSREGDLRRAERRIEEAVKDFVAALENRLIVAGEVADESTSSEVNILSALEVAIHPPKLKDKPKKR